MTFEVAAEAYDSFMGKYSRQLGPQMADLARVRRGQRVVDVGCGPGALTGELVQRLGAGAVSAADPSESFVAAARARFPGVDVRQSTAERLPYADSEFDAALAQLVVHFMTDPVAGLREMARVTRAGGVVVACVWDHVGHRSPLSVFWKAALDLDPAAVDESHMAGVREGHLVELFEQAGLESVEQSTVEAALDFARFEDWWEPFTKGVGPAGAYAASLEESARAELRARCRELLTSPPFTVNASAWAVRGLVAKDRFTTDE